MAEFDDPLAQCSERAIRTASESFRTGPLPLAKRPQDGEIFWSVRLLDSALPHTSTPGLRAITASAGVFRLPGRHGPPRVSGQTNVHLRSALRNIPRSDP